MYAEQNSRNTGNDAGAGVTQREEDTGEIEEAVIVLIDSRFSTQSPKPISSVGFFLCILTAMLDTVNLLFKSVCEKSIKNVCKVYVKRL